MKVRVYGFLTFKFCLIFIEHIAIAIIKKKLYIVYTVTINMKELKKLKEKRCL